MSFELYTNLYWMTLSVLDIYEIFEICENELADNNVGIIKFLFWHLA